jgi:hypothetical protein
MEESAQESKRKAAAEAKSSSSTAPAVQHKRMAVDACQSDETTSAVMPHHPAVLKRSLVVDDDDDDDNNNVTHPTVANQKGDFDGNDRDSFTNDAMNSPGKLIILTSSKIFFMYFVPYKLDVTRQYHNRKKLTRSIQNVATKQKCQVL